MPMSALVVFRPAAAPRARPAAACRAARCSMAISTAGSIARRSRGGGRGDGRRTVTVTHRLRPAELFRDTPLLAPPLGDLEFRCVAASSAMQDDGYALQMSGADLDWFASGRAPLLRQHRPDAIVGRIVAARTTATELLVTCRFASPGISPLADETR